MKEKARLRFAPEPGRELMMQVIATTRITARQLQPLAANRSLIGPKRLIIQATVTFTCGVFDTAIPKILFLCECL